MIYSQLGAPEVVSNVQNLDISQVQSSETLHHDIPSAVPMYSWITHTSGTTGVPKSTLIKTKTVAKGAPLSIPAFALKEYAVRDLAAAPTFLYATSTVSNAPYVKSTLLLPLSIRGSSVAPYEGYVTSFDNGAKNIQITPSILLLVKDMVAQKRQWPKIEIVTLAGEVRSY